MSQREAPITGSPVQQYQDARFPVEGQQALSVDHDEIDLFELIQTIWGGRFKIALIAAMFALLGGIYAFTATQWFESSFKIASNKEDAFFSVNNSELLETTPQLALQSVRLKLLSAENFKDFYLESTIAQELMPLPVNAVPVEYAYSIFNGQFKEVVAKKRKGEEFSLDTPIEFNFTYPRLMVGDRALQAYLEWSQQQVKFEWLNSFNVTRNNELQQNQRNMKKMLNEYNKDTEITKVRSLEDYKYRRMVLQDELEALKTQLIKKNQQRVMVLSENISIARRLGFKKPTTPADVKEIKNTVPVSNSGVEIINSEYAGLDKLPMYYRGFESLEAEKIELNNRNKDQFPSAAIVDMEQKLALLKKDRELEKRLNRQSPQYFIEEYVVLEKRNAHLNTLQLNMSNISLFKLDAKPMAGQAPIKPKKLLILILAGLVGLMLGTLIVLVQGASRKRKEAV